MGIRKKIAVIEEYVYVEPVAVEEEVAPIEEVAPVENEEVKVEETVAEEESVEEVNVVEEEPIEEVQTETVPDYLPEEVAVTEELAAIEDIPVPQKKERKPLLPFHEKMLDADEIIQDRYNELKNYALRYKKIKARVSKKFDSINLGRVQLIKFGLAGKILKLYFNVNIENVDKKFHAKDVSYKKLYQPVPVMLRVKSGRAVRYAKTLIDQVAESVPLKINKKYVEVDYIADLEEVQKLVAEQGKAKIKRG